MQQTEKYKFNIIETSDTFSPDALNANARAAEAALAALEAADAALSKADTANKTALEQALAAQKSELSATDAANKTALEQALAAQKATLEQSIAAQKTTLDQSVASTKSALEKADAALQTAIGSGGKTARITYGTYTGTGKSVTVNFKPLVLFFSYMNVSVYGYGMHIASRNYSGSISAGNGVSVTWGDNSVSWVDNYSSQTSTTVNYYVVIGESA